MIKGKTTTSITKARDELAGLDATHVSLSAKRETLAKELGVAKAARRELLIGDAAGPETVKAERRCVDLGSTLAGVDDALVEVERRRVDAQARLEAAEEADSRTKYADDLDRSAAVIDAVLTKVDAAAMVCAAAITQIKDALPQHIAAKFGLMLVGHERAGSDDIAAALVGAALGARLPDALAVTTSTYGLRPGDILGRPLGGGAPTPEVAEVMRNEAAAVRGENEKPAAAPALVAA